MHPDDHNRAKWDSIFCFIFDGEITSQDDDSDEKSVVSELTQDILKDDTGDSESKEAGEAEETAD